MAIEINTKVTVGPVDKGKKLGNLLFEDAKFFGKPNFRGEADQFKDDRRKFTMLVPNDLADQLRTMGWNVKTLLPQQEGQEELSIIKVMVDDGADVWLRMGEDNEKLTPETFGVVDRSRIQEMDVEIRAWEYDPEEKPGKFSARLVSVVATLEVSMINKKYGMLS